MRQRLQLYLYFSRRNYQIYWNWSPFKISTQPSSTNLKIIFRRPTWDLNEETTSYNGIEISNSLTSIEYGGFSRQLLSFISSITGFVCIQNVYLSWSTVSFNSIFLFYKIKQKTIKAWKTRDIWLAKQIATRMFYHFESATHSFCLKM